MSEKLAISLPRPLFARVEEFRKKSRETRSSFIQRAIRLLLDAHARRIKVGQYVAGYSKCPESAEEVAAAEAAATYLLAQEPWE
jgi:metal-responsive CopG/Arc/MetJ family transcriptional regulator